MNKEFRNLFITGRVGVGKTYLAKQILEDKMKDHEVYRARGLEHRPPVFDIPYAKEKYKLYNCSELMFLARKPSTGEDLYYDCTKLYGLILDDLGVSKKSDFIPDIIYLILNKRMELDRPTIVTSNLTLEQIGDLMDDRLASRLASFEQIELKGRDRRLL